MGMIEGVETSTTDDDGFRLYDIKEGGGAGGAATMMSGAKDG